MKTSLSNIRLTGVDKNYYKNQLDIFAKNIGEAVKTRNEIVRVSFGKQDIRGAISITLFDSNHCVPMQKHFSSKGEMLGFVVGYNAGFNGNDYL